MIVLFEKKYWISLYILFPVWVINDSLMSHLPCSENFGIASDDFGMYKSASSPLGLKCSPRIRFVYTLMAYPLLWLWKGNIWNPAKLIEWIPVRFKGLVQSKYSTLSSQRMEKYLKSIGGVGRLQRKQVIAYRKNILLIENWHLYLKWNV